MGFKQETLFLEEKAPPLDPRCASTVLTSTHSTSVSHRHGQANANQRGFMCIKTQNDCSVMKIRSGKAKEEKRLEFSGLRIDSQDLQTIF